MAPTSDEERVVGLPPEGRADARVLILGSIPGERSLRLKEYYAGSGNRFWRLAGEFLAFNPAVPYSARVAALAESGVALWDVLAHCCRPGSLDASIIRGSETPNDLTGYLATHSQLMLVGLNGGAAAKAFRRFVSQPRDKRIHVVELPSTSGANAAWKYPRLREQWRPVLEPAGFG